LHAQKKVKEIIDPKLRHLITSDVISPSVDKIKTMQILNSKNTADATMKAELTDQINKERDKGSPSSYQAIHGKGGQQIRENQDINLQAVQQLQCHDKQRQMVTSQFARPNLTNCPCLTRKQSNREGP
jgi:hypothetical protein